MPADPPTPRGRRLLERIDVATLPKVLLHEHLDGGIRPHTVVDLAAWFHRGAQRGNLNEYLEGFQHTIAVMQTPEALERIAFEFIEDMHRDGVVYAEARFAPVYHTARDLTRDEVVLAVLRGDITAGPEGGVVLGHHAQYVLDHRIPL